MAISTGKNKPKAEAKSSPKASSVQAVLELQTNLSDLGRRVSKLEAIKSEEIKRVLLSLDDDEDDCGCGGKEKGGKKGSKKTQEERKRQLLNLVGSSVVLGFILGVGICTLINRSSYYDNY